jgi:hypothetical protein
LIASFAVAAATVGVTALALFAGNGASLVQATDTTRTSSVTTTVETSRTVETTTPVTETPVTETPVTETPVTETPVTETPPAGSDGCTPGYWKVRPHRDSWIPTGYTTGQSLESVFNVPDAYGVDSVSLLAAMSFSGGPTTTDAAKLLLHHAVAGLLNSAHPDVDYAFTTAELIADVNAALATNDRATMLALKGEIDTENNRGCTLN